MTALERIVVATDFSETSLHAVDRAFLAARAAGARVAVVHALGMDALQPLQPLLGGERLGEVTATVRDAALAGLADLVADPERTQGVVAQVELLEGAAAEAVRESAARARADLLVVGARGTGLLRRLLLGSTASRLLRRSGCPVLVVRRRARDAYRRALVALDFSPSTASTLRLARAVAPRAELTLLHVFAVPFEDKLRRARIGEDVIERYRADVRERATTRLHEAARAAGLAPRDYAGIVLDGDAARQIVLYEGRCGCDLVVMGKHGTHVTEELLLGSVTLDVLAESRCDVLVVVDPRAAAPALTAG